MPYKTSGSSSFNDFRQYLGYPAALSNIRMSNYYRGGPAIPDVSLNSFVPTSGALSVGDLYGAYKYNTVGFHVSAYLVDPLNSSTTPKGYWSSTGLIAGGPQGSLSPFTAGTLPYTDGFGNNITINSFIYNWPSVGQLTVQLLNAADDDRSMFRVGAVSPNNYFAGRTAAVSSGTAAGGRYWTFNGFPDLFPGSGSSQQINLGWVS